MAAVLPTAFQKGAFLALSQLPLYWQKTELTAYRGAADGGEKMAGHKSAVRCLPWL